LAKRLVRIAEEYDAYIAFEGLKKVKENNNHDELAWGLQLWCYRRVQEFAKYKALAKGLKTIPVNPKNTSKKSPNGRPLKFIDYKVVELGGVVTSRDAIASWNIALRGLKKLRQEQRREERRMRGFRVTWSPDCLACEGMRTRPDARNPEAIKLFKYSEVIASGKPPLQLRGPSSEASLSVEYTMSAGGRGVDYTCVVKLSGSLVSTNGGHILLCGDGEVLRRERPNHQPEPSLRPQAREGDGIGRFSQALLLPEAERDRGG
jgi:IS605 OrfB family transposase